MRGLTIGLIIAMMGIIGGMTIVHHHEDQNREKEHFQKEFYRQHEELKQVQPEKEEEYYRPRRCDERRLLQLYNEMRCSPLYGRTNNFILDRALCEQAQQHAEYSARNRQPMPYSGKYSASQSYGPNNEVEVFQDWMWTPRDHAYITGTYYDRVGFGSAYDQNGRIYWCALYR